MEFSHTKIILKQGSHILYATTKSRYPNTDEIDPHLLGPVRIDSEKLWPLCPPGFTQVASPPPQEYYMKQPSLIELDDMADSLSNYSKLLLHEAQIYEY